MTIQITAVGVRRGRYGYAVAGRMLYYIHVVLSLFLFMCISGNGHESDTPQRPIGKYWSLNVCKPSTLVRYTPKTSIKTCVCIYIKHTNKSSKE